MDFTTHPNVFAPFPMGTIVVLKTGHAPQKVVDIKHENGRYYIRAMYTRWFREIEKTTRTWRIAMDFIKYVGDPEDHDYDRKENVPKMAQQSQSKSGKLYQTIVTEGESQFGTFLAVNSVGKIVLEMKPSGVPQAFSPEEIEEVKPYTIAIRDPHGDLRHFTATKGSVDEGDVLLLVNGVFGIVTGVNTGFEGQTTPLQGKKLVTTDI